MHEMCILRGAMVKTARSSPSGVEFKLLQLFDVLYTTRSVTRAAHLLGQSQPTVSIWLSKLRRQLRDPLFVRTPSGMQPTPAADMLISQAREILESLRRLSAWEPGFVAATAQRRFRICMTDAAHIAGERWALARVEGGSGTHRWQYCPCVESGDVTALGYSVARIWDVSADALSARLDLPCECLASTHSQQVELGVVQGRGPYQCGCRHRLPIVGRDPGSTQNQATGAARIAELSRARSYRREDRLDRHPAARHRVHASETGRASRLSVSHSYPMFTVKQHWRAYLAQAKLAARAMPRCLQHCVG